MKLIKEKDKMCLCLEGELTVKNAAILKEDLLESLQESDCVEIDLDEVTEVDLSCLQLICSAHRTANKEGKVLTIKRPHNSILYHARKDAGFVFQQSCRLFPKDDCLWLGGADK